MNEETKRPEETGPIPTSQTEPREMPQTTPQAPSDAQSAPIIPPSGAETPVEPTTPVQPKAPAEPPQAAGWPPAVRDSSAYGGWAGAPRGQVYPQAPSTPAGPSSPQAQPATPGQTAAQPSCQSGTADTSQPDNAAGTPDNTASTASNAGQTTDRTGAAGSANAPGQAGGWTHPSAPPPPAGGYQPNPGWQRYTPGYQPYQPYVAYNNYIPRPKQREMTGHDRLGILLTVVLGFSFAHFVLFGGLGAGLAFFVGIFYICATLYLRARRPDGAEKPRHAPILFGVIILLTIANLMNSFQALTVLNTIALYLLIVLHLFYVYGKPSYPKYDFRMLLDVIQSTIAMPFRHFDAYFVGMFTGKKHKQSSLALRILLGLLIALPLAFFIIGILMAADDSFREMLHNVFELIATTFWQYLGHFLLGAVLIAPFIFSILYGCRHKTQIFGEAKPVGDGARIADRAVIYTILLVVLGVYLLFFCSQLGYFFPQLASPTPLQLSSYARRGFFELLFLAAFNLGLLGLFYAIIKRKDGRFTPVTKLLFTLFSLSSLLLMASACYKLYRYIEAYGLTRSRVYAAWFMAFLAIVFILVTIKVLVPKLRLFRSGFIAFIAMYLLINFAGVDYWVPAYNIHYFNGSYRVETPVNSLSSSSSAQGLDIDMFSELSDAMVPAVVKLLDSKDMETVQQVTIVLEDRYYEIVNNRKWETWNLSTHIAKKVLQERGIQAVEHNHLHPYEQYYDDPSYGTTSYDPEYDPNSYYDWGDESQPDLSSYPIDPDDRMYNTSSAYHSAYN